MKNTVYAAVAATLAMFATSGIVALATAAPATTPAQVQLELAHQELVDHLDAKIMAQLYDLRAGIDARSAQ